MLWSYQNAKLIHFVAIIFENLATSWYWSAKIRKFKTIISEVWSGNENVEDIRLGAGGRGRLVRVGNPRGGGQVRRRLRRRARYRSNHVIAWLAKLRNGQDEVTRHYDFIADFIRFQTFNHFNWWPRRIIFCLPNYESKNEIILKRVLYVFGCCTRFHKYFLCMSWKMCKGEGNFPGNAMSSFLEAFALSSSTYCVRTLHRPQETTDYFNTSVGHENKAKMVQ